MQQREANESPEMATPDDGQMTAMPADPNPLTQQSDLNNAASRTVLPSEDAAVPLGDTLPLPKRQQLRAKQLVEVCDIDGTCKSVKVETERTDVVGSICIMNSKNRERGKRRVETKTAKVTAIVIVCFIVCWFPFPAVLLYSRFASTSTDLSASGAGSGRQQSVETARNDVYVLSVCLAILAAAINPITYGLTNKQFRHEFKRILNKRSKCRGGQKKK